MRWAAAASSAIPAGVLVAVLLPACAARPDVVPTPGLPAATRSVRPAPVPVPPDAQPARVRWISDGDTLTVRSVRRGVLPVREDVSVRLLEVDTPESKRPGTPVECFAEPATRALARLAPPGSTVWLQPDRELHDRYGRALLYVWNEAGTFVNERLVRGGYARAVLFRPNDRHIDLMREAEASAREAGRGLWSC